MSGGERFEIYELDASTGERRRFASEPEPVWLTWADGYGELWLSNDATTRLTTLTPSTGGLQYSNAPTGSNPFQVAVAGDTVWVGDLDNPRVLRVNAVTRQQLPPVKLPGVLRENGRVFGVAAASGYVWAATPFARSLWKIDAKTNAVERIRMAYPPHRRDGLRRRRLGDRGSFLRRLRSGRVPTRRGDRSRRVALRLQRVGNALQTRPSQFLFDFPSNEMVVRLARVGARRPSWQAG